MLGTPYELEIFLDKVENGDVVLWKYWFLVRVI
jgi:hypothetical protein